MGVLWGVYGLRVFGVCEKEWYRRDSGGIILALCGGKVLCMVVRLMINYQYSNTLKNALLSDFRRSPGSSTPVSRIN